MLLKGLAALLLAAPLSAQTVRVTVPTMPVSPVPGAVGMSAPAFSIPGLTPFSVAPSLTPYLAPASIPVAPVPVVASALSAAPLSAPATPDKPNHGGKLGGRKLALQPATPADGWASRFNFKPASEMFDGQNQLKSEAGAVFAAVPKGQGAVRVHILERGPLAGVKPVEGTQGLSGKALLDKVSALAGTGHRPHDYSAASDFMFSKADNIVLNGVRGVVDAYSGIFVPGTSKEGSDYPEPGDRNGDGFPDNKGMNVEHTWPQSLFDKALPMRSDLHHLMATFMHPNSVRGHMPFGVVTGTPDYENKAGAKRGNGVFEPPDAVKGRVARGLLYYYARYKDSRMFGRKSQVFWNQQIPILLEWNRRFPPDAFEASRNTLVESFQGNRNPFIDDYRLADQIGAEALRHNGGNGRPVQLRGNGFSTDSRRRSSRRHRR
jgi:hypothetical protein